MANFISPANGASLGIYVMDGKMGRTTRAPISALCLIVDKDKGLRSGILS